MGTEIELRFRISPVVRARLVAAEETSLGVLGPVSVRSLRGTYFDLPDHALGRQGIGIRVRAEGAERTLTVKTGRDAAATLGKRREWNLSQEGDRPDLARLLPPGWQRPAPASLPEAPEPRSTPALSQ